MLNINRVETNTARTLLASALTLGISNAVAEPLYSMEDSSHYASVRGWDVYKFKDKFTGDSGCRAIKYENGEPLVLSYVSDSGGRRGNTWELTTKTYQTSTFGGGILGIDKADIDSQFGFREGWATMELTDSAVRSIQNGKNLSVQINQEPSRYFSLTGSTAASLKAEECKNNQIANPSNTKGTSKQRPSPVPTQVGENVSIGAFEACFFDGSIRSIDGAPATVTFEVWGGLGEPVELLWMDHSGNPQSYGYVKPGESISMNSFIGHSWIAKNRDSCSYQEIYPGLQRVIFGEDDNPYQ